ncbi:MAG: PQQ-dependent sugar dehydrogenase [Candidatus Hydrogenedentes bacterium]|nr:PQQ-dependent sugar dehydrogenase [Candidatus Hydrogenedentota bacterium]
MRRPCLHSLSVVAFAFISQIVSAQPSGFQVSTVWSSGFSAPVAVRFTPSGRAFVMEKWGKVYTYDNINDTTPTLVIDLSNQIWTFHDHGSLGLAVDPQFPTRPYIYVLHALRGVPGGRLLRITLDTSTMQSVGNPLVLLEDWAQVYPSHSIGDLQFGPEGALYVTAGDGASYDFPDWGQTEPHNPDGSPLGGIDVPDPVNEGGALRSQDIRSTSDPLGFDGTLLRVHPDTGEAWPGNPLEGGASNDDRILAYGLRNPYRFAIHPTNNSVWICDVGWTQWEELNRVPYPFPNPVPNFGWPAYEGVNPHPQYQGANLPLLQALYAEGTATAPFYTYQHAGSAAITGATFYLGGNYPPEYDGALFFGDYGAGWIKVMFPDANGTPNPANIQTFIATGAGVVDIQRGPAGEIYFVDYGNSRVRRIRYLQGNNPPIAVIQPSVTSGNAPVTVTFTGSASFDPDPGDTISYSWDLDGDDVFGDAASANTQYTYTSSGNYSAKLRVTDNNGASDTQSVTISVNNLPPVPEILFPEEGATWRVGDVIAFGGQATDPETGPMPAAQLSWEVVLYHCATLDFSDCHEHPVLDETGISEGDVLAVDHEYPAYLQLRLTATEPGPNGLSVTVTRDLLPELTTLTLQTNPPGLYVGAFSQTQAAPLVKDVIVNGQTAITAPSPQAIGEQAYVFSSWSDGGAQSHNVNFTTSPMTVAANFVPVSTGTNEPPEIGPLWPLHVTQGSSVWTYVPVSDPDGSITSVSAVNMPQGSQIMHYPDGKWGFEWQTQSGQAGDYVITITATDDGVPPLSVSDNLVVHVLSGNVPPAMDAVWSTTVNAGDFLNLRIGAWDTDGDVPDLYAQNLPPGANYSEDGWGTGFLTWQTTAADVGVYTGIRVYAVDHGEPPLTSERVFTITVLGSANAPVIDPIPSSTIPAGDTLTLNVFAYDPNGTIPVLTAQNLPAGATFTPTGGGNGVFSWPTTAADAGNHSGLTIIATDSVTPSLTYKAMFNVNVVVLSGEPVLDPIGPKGAVEGVQLQFDVTATDPDSGPPSLSVLDLPIGATFIDNGNGTGTFAWTPAEGDAENSPYLVTFSASDETDSDSEIVEITVSSPNTPPHVETIGGKSGVEGVPLAFYVYAHDHDGTVPSLSASNMPSGAEFHEHGEGEGEFHWLPPVGSAENSPYFVTFTASDGELTHSETVSITISPGNSAPVVAAFGPFTIAEEQVWSASVSATDPDGTTPALSAPTLPAGASFVDNGDGTGTISWTPDANASQGSPYAVTISASDGSLSDAKSSTITVTNTNRAPEMAVVGDKTVAENALLQFNVSASDPDGTIPALSAQSLPSGASFVDNGNGTGTFTWTPNFDAAGASPYTVTITASDGTLSDRRERRHVVGLEVFDDHGDEHKPGAGCRYYWRQDGGGGSTLAVHGQCERPGWNGPDAECAVIAERRVIRG